MDLYMHMCVCKWILCVCLCRSEDAAFAHLHNRMSPYPHQQTQLSPHHHTPMSPVSHSKSTEFPRSNGGYFDGPTSLPMGVPIAPASSSGMMSSNLSRSVSSGYVWKDEQPMALDHDPHHFHGKLLIIYHTSELLKTIQFAICWESYIS